ncbi:ABC transporter ATP-binding protein [Lysinibacillus fusiformis]|uniref:ABC transporter ATP-binding protein n=1 Tax=Lysinibacillus fusiformis TaxID=28031 RepID=UPI001967509B|nr:ABC transporter ATP-binding protein [Lysinibacillus fusiformis]QSB08732.1 ABC transporter ATP-binding protein [Lysinibacillus fusiformis]
MQDVNDKQTWGPFFNLLTKSKLPWKWYVLHLIGGIFLATLNVKLPQLTGEIMQGNIFDANLVTQYITVFVLYTISNIALSIFGSWINLNVDRNIQKLVLKKFVRLPIPFFNKLNPSSLTSRITSDATTVSLSIQLLFSLINVTYTLALTLIIVNSINNKMLIAMAFLIPWVIIVSVLPGRVMFNATNYLQTTYSMFTNFVSERLLNLRLIKSSGSEEIEANKGYEVGEKQYKSEVYLAKVNFVVQPFIYSTQAICQIIVIVYGGVLVGKGELEMGQLITLFMYSQMIPAMANQYIICFQQIKKAQGATKKISEIVKIESEKFERKISFALPDDDINFKNVSFSYDGKKVLNNLNFIIPKRKITAIVGPSGSGKTTILNILEQFYDLNSGKITFGKVPIQDIHLDEWRNAFGYVQQNSPLLSGTIRDNIVYGLNREVKDEEVIRAAKLANIYDVIKELPDGLNTFIEDVENKLSGGEKQRIAIARTIIKNPDYLLLDEATCNLDAKNEYEVQSAINNLMKEKTTIVVAHNIKTITNADNIIVIDNGEIKGTGKHETLYNENPLYRKYFDLQFN